MDKRYGVGYRSAAHERFTECPTEQTTPPASWQGTQDEWCRDVAFALELKGWETTVFEYEAED